MGKNLLIQFKLKALLKKLWVSAGTFSKPRPIKPYYLNRILISCPSPFKQSQLVNYCSKVSLAKVWNIPGYCSRKLGTGGGGVWANVTWQIKFEIWEK
jgi:hypothetical protein